MCTTTDWEVVPHIDYPTAKKVRMTELKHRCLLNVYTLAGRLIMPHSIFASQPHFAQSPSRLIYHLTFHHSNPH